MPAEDQIEWLGAKDIRFDRPMFRDSIAAICKSDPSHAITKTKLAGLGEAATGLEQVTPAGLIFHVGRCGSTLLSNAIRAINGTLVLAEPSLISSFFKYQTASCHRFSEQEIGDNMALIVKSFVNILGNTVNHENGVYLKFTSWNTLFLKQIRSIWPNTPIAFAFRDPTDVLDSILAKRVGWMGFYNQSGIASRLLHEPDIALNNISFMNFTVKMLTQLYKTGLTLTDNDLLISYDNNRINNIEKLLAHFMLNPTAEDKTRIQEVSRYYSKKWHKGMIFSEDMNARKCILNKQTQGLVDESGIREIYRGLQSIV